MPARGDFEPYVPAALESIGIEVDEAELAAMRAVHEAYWPALAALLELDLSAVDPEPSPDLSKAP